MIRFCRFGNTSGCQWLNSNVWNLLDAIATIQPLIKVSPWIHLCNVWSFCFGINYPSINFTPPFNELIIVLIAPTHLDLSPTRFTCLSEFACIHSEIFLQNEESLTFYFSTRVLKLPLNTHSALAKIARSCCLEVTELSRTEFHIFISQLYGSPDSSNQ